MVQFLLFVSKEEVRERVPERGSQAQDQAGHQARDGEVGPEIFHLGLNGILDVVLVYQL